MFENFDGYSWLKALHISAVIFWMAGLLYLPRLFVYHSSAEKGGELEAKMEEAEAKLLRIIMNPAMIVTFLLGIVLFITNWHGIIGSWIHIKFLFVFGLMGYHGYLGKTRKAFLNSGRPKSEKFFRRINEIPAITAIIVVILATVKPF